MRQQQQQQQSKKERMLQSPSATKTAAAATRRHYHRSFVVGQRVGVGAGVVDLHGDHICRRRCREVHSSPLPQSSILLVMILLWASVPGYYAAPQQQQQSLTDLPYAVYPTRSQREAAVIEWGHSAIISALDAYVAAFGPQTSDAALFEVETQPVLADPVNGAWEKVVPDGTNDVDEDEDASSTTTTATTLVYQEAQLRNADQVRGNVAVMTNTAFPDVTGVDLAVLAQNSGAAALVVVHVDPDRPDDIYRLVPEDNEREQKLAATIDIPVVVISLSSANLLTSATATEDTPLEEIVNNGMPERIRLYAGGDRPFFEDVQAVNPTVYVIHNLLTQKECESLIHQAAPLVQPLQRNDPLQYTTQYEKFVNTKRVHLWEGTWQSPDRKAIQERIEQVTGFPAAHLSDWTVDQLSAGSYWQPHYDTLLGNYVPMATITVFLSATTSNSTGGDFVFPNTDESDPPLRIQPFQGLAVVHHNTDEQHQFDLHSLHALLPVTTGADEFFYVATKYILALPASNARRVVLPALAAPWQGRLPEGIATLHDALVAQFGVDTGGLYFDKVCVFVPILLVFLLALALGLYVHQQTRKVSISNKSGNGRSSGKKPMATTNTAGAAAGVANPKSTTKKSKKKD